MTEISLVKMIQHNRFRRYQEALEILDAQLYPGADEFLTTLGTLEDDEYYRTEEVLNAIEAYLTSKGLNND